MTLRDLAMLYAALGDDGLAKPLVWTETAVRSGQGEGGRLVSAEAADQVLSILRESPPPPGRAPPALSIGAPKLAFKTGTSYGFRDAVAAGVGDGWTVLVWTGRPDGGARPGMTGREAALPLLFQVFDVLEANAPQAQTLSPQVAPPALTQLDRPRRPAAALPARRRGGDGRRLRPEVARPGPGGAGRPAALVRRRPAPDGG